MINTTITIPVEFTVEEAKQMDELLKKVNIARCDNGLEPYKHQGEFLAYYATPFIVEHIGANAEIELAELGYFEQTGEFPQFT